MATTKTKPIYRFYAFDPALPFRVERRDDGSEVLVQPGYAFVNETVPGDRYSLKRSAMLAATAGYREWEALREMHQPLAAGFVPKLEWDETGAYIEAHVVDPVAQQKVRTGTYKGFSVGVTPTLVNRANEVESCEWVEISLVDRPKDAQAVFTLARVHDLDPDEEVEVEVVDVGVEPPHPPGTPEVAILPETPVDNPSSPAAASTPAGAAAPDREPTLSPSFSPDPSGEIVTPAALDPDAAGDLSHTEAIRQKLREAGLSEELIANVEVVPATEQRALGAPVVPIGPEPEAEVNASVNEVDEALGGGMPEGYRVEQAETGLWCAYGGGVKLGEFETEAEARACLVGVQAAMGDEGVGSRVSGVGPTPVSPSPAPLHPTPQALPPAVDVPERAMEAEDVPVRENLEAKKKPKSYDEKRSQAEIEGLVYSIGDAFTTLMDSLGSILSSEEHDKHGLISQTVGQYGAHLQEICKSKMGRGELAEEVRLLSADLARVIKHEGSKWVVYSESGKKLGEHSSEADARKQLQAIEISKHKNEEGATQPKDRAATVEDLRGALTRMKEKIMARELSSEARDALNRAFQDAEEFRLAAVEDTPAAPETVSEIQRLQATNSDLLQRLADHEKVLTRLAASEAEVKRLGSLPLDKEKQPVRYAHALDRRFLANLGHEGEAAIAVLRLEYEAAEKEAALERHGDVKKRDRAIERMIDRASQLAEHGVYVK